MAVENYFLSREGRLLTSKILKFMRSLVIKMNPEAENEETKETYLAWRRYQYAYEGTDDIYAYDYTRTDCENAGIPKGYIQEKDLMDADKAYALQLLNDHYVMQLLNYLRKDRINSYVEKNSYYAQFIGKPRPGQEIFVANRDKVDPEEPDLLNIEDVKLNTYPYTYEHIFVGGQINQIIEKNPSYYYLKFLENPKTIYQVRKMEQFDIIYADDSLLTSYELANFYKIYNQKKIYMQELMYVEGFNSRYDMYPFMMELLLLQDVFMSFFNSYMDNFALANYSDQEIFDILDSYNLSSLKRVKMTTLRKIIRDIPDLIELRGSDLIIEKLLDIVANDSVTIKRYYLSKVYPIGDDGQLRIDTQKTYEDNVGIVFKEKIIRQGATKIDESTIDYDEFSGDDETWGGELEGLSDEEKTRVKKQFKRELLQMDFSNILTKYLTISSTVNSYTKQIDMQNMLGLLWQFLHKNEMNNFLVNEEIEFEAYKIKPIELYAAICWFHQYFCGVAEPEIINIRNMNISNILALRDNGVRDLVDNVTSENHTIKLPVGLGDMKITDILGKHDDSGQNINTSDSEWPYFKNQNNEFVINYKDVFVDFTDDRSLSEIFADYSKNINIINALKERWLKASTLQEAKCWDYLIQQNLTNTYYEIMFNGVSRFDDFIKTDSREFYNYLNLVLNSYSYENIFAVYVKMLEVFRDFMLNQTENMLSLSTPNADEDDNSVDYLNDLKILFNEFLSIYTELHKIEYSQVLDDSPYNRIKLLYYYDKDVVFNDFESVVRVSDKLHNEDMYYCDTLDMLSDNKLKSIQEQIKSINNYINEFDTIKDTNRFISKQMEKNLTQYIKEEMAKLDNYKKMSIGGLSDEQTSYYTVYQNILNLLSTDNQHLYDEIVTIYSGSITGKSVIMKYSKSEISRLEAEIEELNKRKDILPKFRTYVEFYLYEAFADYIKLYYIMNSDEVELEFRSNIYIKNKLEKLKEYLFYKHEDKLVLKDNMVESPLAYTLFAKEYIKLSKMKLVFDEIGLLQNLSLKIKIKQNSDILSYKYNTKLKLYDTIVENII